MLLKDCKDCTYLVSLIALGQGARCNKTENNIQNENNLPILISKVKDCKVNEGKLK